MAEERTQRRLAAILIADVVGYSRLMEADEEGTLRRLRSDLHELFEPKLTEHRGRLVKTTGDGLIAEFPSVVDAVRCALDLQQGEADRNISRPEGLRLLFRMGINLGDVIHEDGDLYGDGVNVAARLEALAEAGTVMISGTAYDQVEKKLPIGFEYRGEQRVKNIDKPVRVYRVLTDAAAAGRTIHAIRRPQLYWGKIGVSAAVVLLFLGGVVGAYVRPWEAAPRRAPASGDKPSIAVLPFANMSGDPKQEYFADGMTDDVITALSQVTGLFVIARNSSFTYKGTSVDIQKIAKDLEVRYVLEGSVQRAGDRVRITAWLVDSSTGGNRWADQFDGPVSDVFALQDKVKRSVADALAVQLAGAGAQSPATPETNIPGAYDAFLRGWEHYRRHTPQDFAKAIPYFEEAIKLDSAYERPHAAIAMIYVITYNYGWTAILGVSAREALSRARLYLDGAKKHPTAMTHQVAGFLLMIDRKSDLALAEFKEAIALDPGLSSSYQLVAFPLISSGRPADALHYIDIAMRLDPHPPANFMFALGLAQFSLEQFESAAASLESATRLNPEDQTPYLMLAAAYGYLARKHDAQSAVTRYNDIVVGLGGVPVTVQTVQVERNLFLPQLADWQRMQNGLRLAGVPDFLDRSDFAARNRLAADDIRSQFFGHRLHGHNLFDGAERMASLTDDGRITLSGDWGTTDAGGQAQSGTLVFEGAEVCLRLGVVSYCGVMLRNPGGSKATENDFLWASPSGGYTFTIAN